MVSSLLVTALLVTGLLGAAPSASVVAPEPIAQWSTCGYRNGDASRPRIASPGFNCRVDAHNSLWGFCPTTVVAASDCGLAGSCVDSHACSDGCGFTLNSMLTTFTCSGAQYCSTALLTVGVDQTYSYLACGPNPSTERYMALPTTTTHATTTTTTTASAAPAATSSSSRSSPGPTTVPPGAETAVPPAAANPAPIIGGVLGGLALLSVSAIAIVYLMRQQRPHSQLPPQHPPGNPCTALELPATPIAPAPKPVQLPA